MGIDAACALALHDALGAAGEGIDIVDHDEEIEGTLVEAREFQWLVRISPDVRWNSDGVITVPGLPDTVAAALAGQPLVHLISHPALDPHQLVISSVTPGEDQSVVHLAQIPVADLDVRAVDGRITPRPRLAA